MQIIDHAKIQTEPGPYGTTVDAVIRFVANPRVHHREVAATIYEVAAMVERLLRDNDKASISVFIVDHKIHGETMSGSSASALELVKAMRTACDQIGIPWRE